MEHIVFCLSMVQKFTISKTVSKTVPSPLCLESVSKDQSIDNMKKKGFTGYVSDFSVDYSVTDVGGIKDIHKYLTKNNDIV